MPKIARIELYHVAVPLPATFHPSWIPGFPQNENRFDLLRVLTDDGVEGWSAGPAMGREREGLGSLVGPYLIGEEATDIPLIQQRLREISYLGWRNWWMEPAFWDIRGKVEGKPVCELLGGRPERVRVYASCGEVRRPADAIAVAEARRAEGFDTIKLRVHDFDEAVDIRQVQETARAMGDSMKIGVDANQAWRVAVVADAPRWDLERARRFVDACAEVGVAWIEEPLPMDAYDDQVALTEYSSVPISGGEIHTGGLAELRMMIERRCYHIFQPDAVFTGGIAQTAEIARLCKEAGLGYTPHTWTNGFGFAVNLQLLAGTGFAGQKPLEYPYDPPGWTVAERDGVLKEPFFHRDGWIDMSHKPGLGIEVDHRALRRWGERFFVMDQKRLIYFSLRDRGLKASLEIDRNRRARRAGRSDSR